MIDWPAQSPDCNPIENVRALIKAKIKVKNIQTVKDIIGAIKAEWESLSVEYARKLAESCPSHCRAIIANNGDWIPYLLGSAFRAIFYLCKKLF